MGIIAKAIQAYKDLYELKGFTESVSDGVNLNNEKTQNKLTYIESELGKQDDFISAIIKYQESNNETISLIKEQLDLLKELTKALESDLAKVLALNHETDKKVAALIASRPNQNMYNGVLKT